MKFDLFIHFLIALFLSGLSFVNADDTETETETGTDDTDTTTQSPTLVWVTGTNSLGLLVTTQSEYTQQFFTLYSSVPQVLSGAIGMGSVDGSASVGDIRTYPQVTISNSGRSISNHVSVTKGVNIHYILALIGLLVVPFISTVIFL